MRKKIMVILVDGSLLRGVEGPICWKNIPLKEVCTPGVKVKDVTTKFPSLVQCSDYHPLLILHDHGDEITTCSQSKGHQKRL